MTASPSSTKNTNTVSANGARTSSGKQMAGRHAIQVSNRRQVHGGSAVRIASCLNAMNSKRHTSYFYLNIHEGKQAFTLDGPRIGDRDRDRDGRCIDSIHAASCHDFSSEDCVTKEKYIPKSCTSKKILELMICS